MSRKLKMLPILFSGSIIHSYIRFFECLFHIAYRLEVKMWQVGLAENRTEVATRKAGIIGGGGLLRDRVDFDSGPNKSWQWDDINCNIARLQHSTSTFSDYAS
jgi:hypothetical protein